MYFKTDYGNWKAQELKGMWMEFQINRENISNIHDSISLSAL